MARAGIPSYRYLEQQWGAMQAVGHHTMFRSIDKDTTIPTAWSTEELGLANADDTKLKRCPAKAHRFEAEIRRAVGRLRKPRAGKSASPTVGRVHTKMAANSRGYRGGKPLRGRPLSAAPKASIAESDRGGRRTISSSASEQQEIAAATAQEKCSAAAEQETAVAAAAEEAVDSLIRFEPPRNPPALPQGQLPVNGQHMAERDANLRSRYRNVRAAHLLRMQQTRGSAAAAGTYDKTAWSVFTGDTQDSLDIRTIDVTARPPGAFAARNSVPSPRSSRSRGRGNGRGKGKGKGRGKRSKRTVSEKTRTDEEVVRTVSPNPGSVPQADAVEGGSITATDATATAVAVADDDKTGNVGEQQPSLPLASSPPPLSAAVSVAAAHDAATAAAAGQPAPSQWMKSSQLRPASAPM